MMINLSRDNIEDIYPMSDIEMGMVYHSLKNPDDSVYHNQMVFQRLVKDFDHQVFKKAMLLMMQKHPILRTCFDMYGADEPVQILLRSLPADIEHYHISQQPRDEQELFINATAGKDRQKRFDFDTKSGKSLWRMKTFDLGNDHICFMWICHHAIMDGWSAASLMTELSHTYLELTSDPAFVPARLKSSYKEFVVEQLVMKEDPAVPAYWQEELAGYKRFEFPPACGPAADRIESAGQVRRKIFTMNLGQERLGKLKRAAVRYDSGLKHLCFAAYVYMLGMLSREADVTVGLVTNNRPDCEDGEKILGCFLNTVPVRVKVAVGEKWSRYIRRVDRKLKELARYDRLSLFEIARITGEKVQEQNPVFDTMFNYVDFFVYDEVQREEAGSGPREQSAGKLSIASQANTNTLFDFTISATHGSFGLGIHYAASRIAAEWVERCSGYFVQILDKLSDDPESLMNKDSILSRQEKEKLLHTFNDTQAPYPAGRTIYEMFVDQAERTPFRRALSGLYAEPGSSGAEIVAGMMQLTYGEFTKQSERLARFLRERGVGNGAIVSILTRRSVGMMVGIFAILKAGGAYMPIDPDYPPARIRYMFADSGSSILIISSSPGLEVEKFRSSGIEMIVVEEVSSEPGASNRRTLASSHSFPSYSPGGPAYVIYTSGSTGEPKGVMIRHDAVVNRLNWMQRGYPISEDDVILQKTPVTFDVSVWELFWWSFYGASLCLLVPDGEKNPEEIVAALRKYQITTMHFVPSMLNAFLEYLEERQKEAGFRFALRRVFSSGEELPGYQADKFNRLLNRSPGSDLPAAAEPLELVNLYGPTEATVDVTYFNCPTIGNTGFRSVPIGKPIDNIRLYILSKEMELQPIGVPGELFIAGIGLAAGYLNRPDLTAEKFLTVCEGFAKFQRIYKTGDLVRWLADGNIEFLGRIDFQVKIRGFRIELGEIEHHLMNHPDIKKTAVLIKADGTGSRDLYAYVVSNREIASSLPGIKEHLARQLPGYMIPSYFIQVEDIPLSANGKVDRKALQALSREMKPTGRTAGYAAPENEAEKTIAGIWSDILHIDKVGVLDNFFDVGGHSLNVIQVNSRLRKVFKKEISITDMFRYPSIRDLAGFLSSGDAQEFVSDEEIDESTELLEEAATALFIDEID